MGERPPEQGADRLERALAGLAEPAPAGFAAGVLRAAGIAPVRYDGYTAVPTAAGPLYVAHRAGVITGAALAGALCGYGAQRPGADGEFDAVVEGVQVPRPAGGFGSAVKRRAADVPGPGAGGAQVPDPAGGFGSTAGRRAADVPGLDAGGGEVPGRAGGFGSAVGRCAADASGPDAGGGEVPDPAGGFGSAVGRRAADVSGLDAGSTEVPGAAGEFSFGSGAGGPLAAIAFEEAHRARTGRSAVPVEQAPPGLRTALRTGRFARLPLAWGPVPPPVDAVLAAVRTVPRGQLRPVSWLAREAGGLPPHTVLAALAANPVSVLVPTYRITDERGLPHDIGYGTAAGAALRAAEAIDADRVAELARRETVFLGSDTTRIYCHPTCAHARRITERHQVPFRSASQARHAGYRPCKSCRPAA
ncbi:Ada metal-binding domain-containing protein [Actinacidiphila sp. bgisy144]|uniref:Ada metal-binding domain-containing protein n=1 Tax=Actinacidiphila sp. bgisy144 TaxID=3413791 RepID=UPI003EBC5A8D